MKRMYEKEIERFKNGEISKGDFIVSIIPFIESTAGAFNHDAKEDLVQDIVLELLEKLNNTVDAIDLIGIMVNTINSKSKKYQSANIVCYEDLKGTYELNLELMAWNCDVQRIAKNCLNETEQQILYKRFYENETLKETANAVHYHPGHVRVVQSKALRKIRGGLYREGVRFTN